MWQRSIPVALYGDRAIYRALYGAEVHLWGTGPPMGPPSPWSGTSSCGRAADMGHRAIYGALYGAQVHLCGSLCLTMWHMTTYWALYGALYGAEVHLWGAGPSIGLSMGHRAIYGALQMALYVAQGPLCGSLCGSLCGTGPSLELSMGLRAISGAPYGAQGHHLWGTGPSMGHRTTYGAPLTLVWNFLLRSGSRYVLT